MKVIFELIRYRNCAMAGLAAVIGAAIALKSSYFIASPDTLLWMPLIFISVFLITGAGNSINDYFDAKIDAINRPERPIPSGRLKKEFVFKFSICLFVFGVIISWFIGSWELPFVIALHNSFLLYLYAWYFKRMPFIGNMSVSYLTGSTFLYGGSAYGYFGVQSIFILFSLSMFATFSREIVKTIQDIEGDKKEGALTLPILIGVRDSKYFACIFALIAVVLSPFPYLTKLFNEYYLFTVGIADIVFLYAIYLILTNQPTKSSKNLKIAMFFGLIAFIVGSISI